MRKPTHVSILKGAGDQPPPPHPYIPTPRGYSRVKQIIQARTAASGYNRYATLLKVCTAAENQGLGRGVVLVGTSGCMGCGTGSAWRPCTQPQTPSSMVHE